MGVVQRFRGKQSFDTTPAGHAVSGLTAHAGGTQALALQLSGDMASIGTVASVGDSVRLPTANPGALYYLSNDGANALQVFGKGTDTINNVATATGVAQGAGVAAKYFCAKLGNWSRIQSS